MKKHTQRVVGILKQVLTDLDEIEKKTGSPGVPDAVIAYTSKTTTPNIYRHDVDMMIKELECECSHPNGMFTKCFAPETCCPDQLITFSQGGKRVSVNCRSICCHHINHKMTEAEELEETLKRR